jgi:hypothetical protein
MKQTAIFLFITVMLTGLIRSEITVISPNGGEVWYKNTTRTITWNPGGHGGDVVIKLYKDGVDLGKIINSTPNNGSGPWKIDKLTNGTPINEATTYKIRIRVIGQEFFDMSNNNFSIKPLLIKKDFIYKVLPLWEKNPTFE